MYVWQYVYVRGERELDQLFAITRRVAVDVSIHTCTRSTRVTPAPVIIVVKKVERERERVEMKNTNRLHGQGSVLTQLTSTADAWRYITLLSADI